MKRLVLPLHLPVACAVWSERKSPFVNASAVFLLIADAARVQLHERGKSGSSDVANLPRLPHPEMNAKRSSSVAVSTSVPHLPRETRERRSSSDAERDRCLESPVPSQSESHHPSQCHHRQNRLSARLSFRRSSPITGI